MIQPLLRGNLPRLGRPDSVRDSDASRTDPANRDERSRANWPGNGFPLRIRNDTIGIFREIPDAVRADQADHGTWLPLGSDSVAREEPEIEMGVNDVEVAGFPALAPSASSWGHRG
jgi:hypothetical protein